MDIPQLVVLILALITFLIALILAPIAGFRALKSMFVIWRHVKPEALERSLYLRMNRLNAIFYPDALDDEGVKARRELAVNTWIFVGLIGLTFVLVYASGIKA